jgi:NDP-sugar pyrophosphorylase family protein
MVGGEGRRLRPLTNHTPKPLLPVGKYTILEHTLMLLRQYGITDVTLAVNYLASKIEAQFGDGRQMGMRITYQREPVPLGTAGALSLLPDFDDTILMMNGDILTDLDVSELTACHYSHAAVITVASKRMYTDLSLGVLDVQENGLVNAYREKPRLEHRFGIGMYIVGPEVKQYLQPVERIDVPDLITRLIAAGRRVASYDHSGRWTDVGAPEEYARVQEEALGQVEFAAAFSMALGSPRYAGADGET